MYKNYNKKQNFRLVLEIRFLLILKYPDITSFDDLCPIEWVEEEENTNKSPYICL